MIARAMVLPALLALAACRSVVPDADQPAVIIDPTDASRAALQQAVNEALGSDVMLAPDALTDSSVLIIERRLPQSVSGSPAQGRTMEEPARFSLMTNGTACVLVADHSGARYLLADTDCVARQNR